jgi:hypothetical protein
MGDMPKLVGVPGWKCSPASSLGNDPTLCGVPGPGAEEKDELRTASIPTGREWPLMPFPFCAPSGRG